jgi:hypothetical protein
MKKLHDELNNKVLTAEHVSRNIKTIKILYSQELNKIMKSK